MKVATGFDLPLQAATETFGILAVRRAGKSNAGVVIAEAMYDAGIPWVAIDPKGDWWGIRSSKDGKTAGLAVPVFGGMHADLPLEPRAGAYIADLVAEKRLTCVLDVSEMDSKADQTRFLVGFAERLLKVNREPLHLFLEEADEYLPQKVEQSFQKGEISVARVVGAVGKLVRRGGFRGIGTTLISQRAAVVNKDVTTQIGTLIVLRTTSPQDRAAIRDWVRYKAGGVTGEMLESLPELANGEAWVWSPEFLKIAQRVQFHQRRTFDSGATPEVGKRRIEPTRLADVDLAAIKEAMGEFIQRAEAQDPAKLHKRIRVLEAELAKVRAEKPVPEVRVERVEVPVLPEDVLDRLEEALDPVGVALAGIDEHLAKYRPYVDAWRAERREGRLAAGGYVRSEVPTTHPDPDVVTVPARAPRRAPDTNGDTPALTPAKQKILDALAWLETVRIPEASKRQLALLIDMTAGGGAFANYLGALRTAGLLDYPKRGLVALTGEGRKLALYVDGPKSSVEMHELLFRKVGPAKARILKVLIEAYPQTLSKEELATAVGMTATGGAFANYLGALRSLGLIDYPAPGQVVALPVLFLDRR